MIGRDTPVGPDEFQMRMNQLGPFERRPHLAVALSGGVDSLTLLALAIDWTRRLSGQVSALIVDHALRSQSAAEALTVRDQALAMGAKAEILHWAHGELHGRIQERARRQRYALLDQACGRLGVLHLLVGHQHDDQLETIAMRRERGSHAFGLAGMSAIVELQECRLLRPLLPWKRGRVLATARKHALRWIEDPSNRSPRFWRGHYRLAARSPELGAVDPSTRRRSESAFAARLAAGVFCHPLGVFGWHLDALAKLPPAEQAWLLGRLAAALGGLDYPALPSQPLQFERVRTFGGVMFAPRAGHGFLLREPARIQTHAVARAGTIQRWDNRFVLDHRGGRHDLLMQPRVASDKPELNLARLARPASVLAGLPRVALAPGGTGEDQAVHLLSTGARPLLYFGTQKPLTLAEFAS